MPLSEDADRILGVLKDAGIEVGQSVDDRLISTTVWSNARRFAAVHELADRGYIRIDEENTQFVLTDLGYDVIYDQSYSRQNWKPWRK